MGRLHGWKTIPTRPRPKLQGRALVAWVDRRLQAVSRRLMEAIDLVDEAYDLIADIKADDS